MDNEKQVKKPTAEQMQDWKARFEKVFKMKSEDEVNGEVLELVVRKPSRSSFERYQDDVMKKGAKAMYQFALENTLFPDRETMAEILDDKPGLASGIASKLQDEMGISVGFTMIES